MEKLWREAFRSLYNCFSPMNIVFEDDIYVDLPYVLNWKPGYVNSPLLEFFAKARCPPVLTPSEVAAVKVYGSEEGSLQT